MVTAYHYTGATTPLLERFGAVHCPAGGWIVSRIVPGCCWEKDGLGNFIAQCEPWSYDDLPGWYTPVNTNSWADVPPAALGFIEYVEEMMLSKVSIVSWGPTFKDKMER